MPFSDPAAIEEFRHIYDCVQNHTSLRRVWDRVFTAEERRRLGGDVATANQAYFGPVGMWVHLHGGTSDRAVVEVAQQLGFANDATRAWLLQALGEEVSMPSQTVDRPGWDKASGELYFRGTLIRRVRSPHRATNIVAVLDALQEANWPRRLADPLWGGNNSLRLHATIRCLNKDLDLIVFSSDGNGAGYVWRCR
jgi:hypothetical protein